MAPIVDKTERRLASHKRGLLNSRDLIGRKEDHIGNVGRNERRDLGSGKHERLKKGAKVSVCDRLGEMYYFKNSCFGFHQVSKHEKTFYCFRVFGNLMKPEARVFEITSPTKKLEAVVILMSFLDSNVLFVDRNQRFEALIEIPLPTF